MQLGNEIPDASIEERIEAQKPGTACSLIYTSGTTGSPKAVMISHDNMTWTAEVRHQRRSGMRRWRWVGYGYLIAFVAVAPDFRALFFHLDISFALSFWCDSSFYCGSFYWVAVISKGVVRFVQEVIRATHTSDTEAQTLNHACQAHEAAASKCSFSKTRMT